MYCPSCQMTYQQGARYCGRCGSPLAVQSLTSPVAEQEGRMALAAPPASASGEAVPGFVALPTEASPVSRQGRWHGASLPEGGAEEADAASTLLLRPGDHASLNVNVLGGHALPRPSLPRSGSTPDLDLFALDDLLSEEERRIRDLVSAFCQREVAPVINDYWEREAFSFELLPGLARLRIAGGALQGYGCPGMSAVAAGLAVQELARGDAGLCTFFSNHTFLAMRSIALYGSEEQKQRWLPALARLEQIGGFALTEQHLSSSDASNLGTLARRVGPTYLLTGTKRWIVNATFADVMVVWARDEQGQVGAFLVEKGAPGFEARIIPGKMAQRTLWCTDLTLNQVQIPLENRLPGVRSFQSAIELLTGTRVTVSWIATGLAMAAYEVALDLPGSASSL